jgi:trans-aconitate methyltransferase
MSLDLIESERRKYRKAWGTDRYQTHSPGARIARDVVSAILGLQARSLTDYGCGNGRAMEIFSEHCPELAIHGVDLVATEAGARARCPTARIWDACLWELPLEVPVTDFAFSCDVLEHLPPEHVSATLQAMAERTRLGGFIQVFTAPDHGGHEIGETLHLTVEPWDWWKEEIGRFFDVAIVRVVDVRPQFYVRSRP